MKTSFVLTVFLLLVNLKIFSQSAVYSGTVCCSETGRVLKDVHIKVLESGETKYSDFDGFWKFCLEAKEHLTLVFDKPGFVVEELKIKNVTQNIKVNLKPRKTSAATYRWNKYIESEEAYKTLNFVEDENWKCDFKETNLTGDFTPDSTLIRRDPSAVIKVDSLYYVYYTHGDRFSKGLVKKRNPWDQCEIWYASSKDGWNWKEQGLAVEKGAQGDFDDCSVFTPEILAYKDKYYLVYQAVNAPYVDRELNSVGMAIADSPGGPWRKLPEPILTPTHNGIWLGDDDSREAFKKGDFDSHKVHDPCLMFYKNKFYLYYKGQRIGEHRFYGEREIKWGLAIAENPEGPYVKSEYNPITNTGHEVCVWHYKGGIALIHTQDGPEAKTIQWSPDGINFELMSTVAHTPEALGLFRTKEHDKSPLEGISWGLCHAYGKGNWRTSWNYIKRFDLIKE